MAITSSDILNLSHSLKDICEVNCDTPECLSQALKILLQYNLIQANLQFGRQFDQTNCPVKHATPSPVISSSDPNPLSSVPAAKPPRQLDIGDPFLADHER